MLGYRSRKCTAVRSVLRLKTLNRRLVATHIADNNGLTDQHLLPFEGTINWERVVAGLKDIGYRGLFNLEVGGAVYNIPLELREEKLHYALELTKALLKEDYKGGDYV